MYSFDHRIAADINLYLYVGLGFVQESIAEQISSRGESYNEFMVDEVQNEAIQHIDILEALIVQEGWADAIVVEFDGGYQVHGDIDYEGMETPLDEGEITELEKIVEDWLNPFVEEAIETAETDELVWIPVEDSSNVEAFAYDYGNKYMWVKFLPSGSGDFAEGSTYLYYDVESQIYDLFLQAPSKGKFVWGYLRDRYEYARMA